MFQKFIEKYFSHIITVTLLILAGVFKSAAIAYASVACLSLVLVKETYEKVVIARESKNGELDEAKKLIQSLNTRITTIEYGIKTRGF